MYPSTHAPPARIPIRVNSFCSLESVKLPWQKSDAPEAPATTSSSTAEPAASSEPEKKLPKGYTPPKGRPTPKRHEQEIKRGVVRDPNAMSRAQASQKRKEMKASMSKEEWKEYKKQERAERRAQNKDIQAKMDAGDERYLLDRDKGEVRRYVRDWVDSRRFLSNYVMPGALILLVIMLLGQFFPEVAAALSVAAMFFILATFAEGIFIGQRANKAVRAKSPDSTETGFGLGMYAFSRASQPRNWRTPKPQVAIGNKV